jgi:hypothetical protein
MRSLCFALIKEVIYLTALNVSGSYNTSSPALAAHHLTLNLIVSLTEKLRALQLS